MLTLSLQCLLRSPIVSKSYNSSLFAPHTSCKTLAMSAKGIRVENSYMNSHVVKRHVIRSHDCFGVDVSWSCDLVLCQDTPGIWLFLFTSHLLYVCLLVIGWFSQVEQKRCTRQKRVLCRDWLTQCHMILILARFYWLSHFHSACTECISNVLWRREFGWSSFVFSNHAFFFARKSCGRSIKGMCLWGSTFAISHSCVVKRAQYYVENGCRQ